MDHADIPGGTRAKAQVVAAVEIGALVIDLLAIKDVAVVGPHRPHPGAASMPEGEQGHQRHRMKQHATSEQSLSHNLLHGSVTET